MQQKRSLFSIIVTTAVSLLVATSFVSAVTTISTDVTTDGLVHVGGGSVSAPSIAFQGDTNTGFFNQIADTISFTTNGIERLRYSASSFASQEAITFSTTAGDLTIDANDKFIINDDTGIGYTDTANQVIATGTFAINKNVGIGTTNPTASLHVSGTDASYLARLSSSSGTGTIQLNAPTGSNTNFYFAEGGSNRAVIFYQIGGVLTINRSLSTTGGIHITSSDDIGISYNNSGNNVIASGAFAINKNVGIGTTNPATALAISGGAISWPVGVAITAARYEIARDLDGTNQLHFNIPTGATYEFSINDVAEYVASSTDLDFSTNTASNIGHASNDIGSFGYRSVDGTVSAPAISFTSDTDTGFFRLQENVLSVGIGTTNVMSVTGLGQSGRVGIGTTNPAQSLSVAGTIESTSGGFKFPDGTTQTAAVVGGPMTLLLAANGSTTNASAENVSTVAISGLTAKDTLIIYATFESVAQNTANVKIYNVTDGVDVVDVFGGNLFLADKTGGATLNIRQAQSANTKIVIMGQGMREVGTGEFVGLRTATFTTAWTGSWTLALRQGGVVSGGTFRWTWSVYKVTGQ